MDNHKAELIVSKWISYWNEKSLDEYLNLLSNDIELVSSLTLRLIPESHGQLKGKKMLREFWEIVRKKMPNFIFEFSHFFTTKNKIIVHYNTLDHSVEAIAILTIDEHELICKMEISYL